MLPPSRASAVPSTPPCWLAMLTLAASSSHKLRALSSYRHRPSATAAGMATTAIAVIDSRRRRSRIGPWLTGPGYGRPEPGGLGRLGPGLGRLGLGFAGQLAQVGQRAAQ